MAGLVLMQVESVIDSRTTVICLHANGMISEPENVMGEPEPVPMSKDSWRKIGDDWLEAMPPEGHPLREAYEEYIHSGYRSINGGLRGLRDMSPETAEHVANLDRLFKERGVALESATELYRIATAKGDFDPTKWAAGEYVVDAGFTSTAVDNYVWGVSPGEGGRVALTIVAPRGTRVIPGNAVESEAILPRNARFKVLKGYKDGHVTLQMEAPDGQ